MSKQLDLRDLSVTYGSFTSVDSVNLSLAKGEIGCLLGPSGCGKSSLLRAIAGFQKKITGEISIADSIVDSEQRHVPAEKRRVGMLFQDIALFPHLNVIDNITFGIQNTPKAEKENKALALLDLIGLMDKKCAYPHELSGGQQQRVALARALAPEPSIILLDEPFSSLDAELSTQMANEIRLLLKQSQTTALMVTHDEKEAFAMADKMGVMNQGQLLQWGTSYELYHQPKCRFVAGFVGEGRLLHATVNDCGELVNGLGVLAKLENTKYSEVKEPCFEILIRPDDIVYAPDSEHKALIKSKCFRGAEHYYEIELADGQTALCEVASHINLSVGDHLPLQMDLAHLVLFPKANS